MNKEIDLAIDALTAAKNDTPAPPIAGGGSDTPSDDEPDRQEMHASQLMRDHHSHISNGINGPAPEEDHQPAGSGMPTSGDLPRAPTGVRHPGKRILKLMWRKAQLNGMRRIIQLVPTKPTF